MERVKNYVLGSAVLIIAALVISLATDLRRAVADEFKNVLVINSQAMPANVRDVDNAARQPLYFDGSYTVPAGKRLVIENISLGVRSPTPSKLVLALKSDNILLHQFFPTFIGTFIAGPGGDVYVYGLSQETRAYIEENKVVSIALWSFTGGDPSIDHAGVTGYLVDIP